jgi:hypothetical protein
VAQNKAGTMALHILCLEDNADDRRLMEKELAKDGLD